MSAKISSRRLKISKTVIFTGHRKINGSYDLFSSDAEKVRKNLKNYISKNYDLNSTIFISGMALGFDQLAAMVVISLGGTLKAAVPFIGQPNAWPKQSQDLYYKILKQASEVIMVSDKTTFSAYLMQKRNEWMVDWADEIICYWDGSTGGTNNCIKYARKKGKEPVLNLWKT